MLVIKRREQKNAWGGKKAGKFQPLIISLLFSNLIHKGLFMFSSAADGVELPLGRRKRAVLALLPAWRAQVSVNPVMEMQALCPL